MRVIIAGSREITDYFVVHAAMEKCGFRVTEVVSGTARGVDKLGEEWGELVGWPVTRFPANWDKEGKAAGHIRNGKMAKYADALVAVWDGKSPGTQDMIKQMEALGKPVYVYNPTK